MKFLCLTLFLLSILWGCSNETDSELLDIQDKDLWILIETSTGELIRPTKPCTAEYGLGNECLFIVTEPVTFKIRDRGVLWGTDDLSLTEQLVATESYEGRSDGSEYITLDGEPQTHYEIYYRNYWTENGLKIKVLTP